MSTKLWGASRTTIDEISLFCEIKKLEEERSAQKKVPHVVVDYSNVDLRALWPEHISHQAGHRGFLSSVGGRELGQLEFRGAGLHTFLTLFLF
jgi:hypothetical protein